MPPTLALFVTAGLIALLLWRDGRRQAPVGRALWLPVLWVFLISSKFVGQWLAVFGISGGGQVAMEDGSALDAVVFLALILAGVGVLVRRGTSVPRVVADNWPVVLFLLFGLLSVAWSDFPFVALKRWVKALGHPVMALVVLSEVNPTQAIRRLVTRSAILYAPLAVLVIKYYPWLGRGFDPWSGAATNHGISNTKNDLGYVCMFLAVGLFWNLMCARRTDPPVVRRDETLLSVFLLGLVLWLLLKSNSATSSVCVALGVATLVALGLRFVNTRLAWLYTLVAVTLGAVAEVLFGVSRHVYTLVGRDSTLTDRSEVWADVLAMDFNPLVGTGFESFWLGPRLEALWDRWWWQPNQAHNGYIETYINLGLIGLVLLAVVSLAAFSKAQRDLQSSPDLGRFRFAWLLMILTYNYTEATFKGVHLVWTVFHLIAMDYTRQPIGQRRGAALGGREVLRPAVRPRRATQAAHVSQARS